MITHAERMALFKSAGLYLVTSQELSAGRPTLEVVAAALRGGVRLVQLREKSVPLRALAAMAEEVRALTRRHDALLIINDRVDLALAVGADGVHLGQDDLPVEKARALAPDLIIGASTHSIAEAEHACKVGASYLNIGPLFPTATKQWSDAFLGVEGLDRIRSHVRIPFTVMGGIKAGHIPELVRHGARTIAVVTALTMAPDPEQAARHMLSIIRAALPAAVAG